MITARRKRFKDTFRLALLLFLISISIPAAASPLRIWVMHNEPASEIAPTAGEVRAYLDSLREGNGIIIENNVQDLLKPTSQDNAVPIANQIIPKNQFIEEVKEFRRGEQTEEPILVKFIRWNDAFNRFMTARRSMPPDQMPDIIQIGSTWIASFADAGALENLEGRIDEKDFFKPAIQSAHPYEMDGLYAVPWFIDIRLLYYWKDKIPQSALKDFASFKSDCTNILARNPSLKGVIGISTAVTWNLLHNLSPWLWANGGDIIGARFLGKFPMHEVRLDDPKSIEAISFLRDLSVSKCAYLDDLQMESMELQFLQREVASVITVPEFLRRLPDGWEDKIAIAMPPAGTEGSFPFMGGSHLAIWFGARERGNFERALSLISFLTSPASEKRFSASAGFLPARREALSHWLSLPYMDVFSQALDNGRSYPAVPEWGSIVENEFVRTHFWQIWQGISQGQPMEIIEGTVKSAALELRKKTALALWNRSRWYAISLFGSIICVGGLFIARSRRRYNLLELQFEKTSRNLLDVEGQRTALQGQMLLLERKEKKQIERIGLLREKIKLLGNEAKELSTRLSSISERRRETTKPLLGDVRISWNGRLILDGEEIQFENANQAHRLIEHLARQMACGVSTVSCLWGYALFGWDAKKLHSLPNRLFNTAVSKINSAITAKNRPPLLKSEGKNSWRWRCLWDRELFLNNCDVALALKSIDSAGKARTQNDESGVAKLAAEALETDPRCIEAIRLLESVPAASRPEIETVTIASARTLKEHVEELRRGVEAIEHLLAYRSDIEEYRELLQHEACAMKHKAGHLSKCLDGLSPDAKRDQKRLHLTDILCRLSSIQSDITTLRASGVAEKGVWSMIVHDEKFVGLLSIPTIQSVVNRFYNHETRTMEDPRLVQLALVLMLSRPEQLVPLEKAETDEEFFGGFQKQLQKQFRALEQEMALSY